MLIKGHIKSHEDPCKNVLARVVNAQPRVRVYNSCQRIFAWRSSEFPRLKKFRVSLYNSPKAIQTNIHNEFIDV